jgi:hypothetical protein
MQLFLRSVSWLFGYHSVPFSARANFRSELHHVALWSLLWGSINGNLCAYIASHSLGASAWLQSAIASSMPFANLFTVWWVSMMKRTGHVRAMTTVLLLSIIILLSTTLTPLLDGMLVGQIPSWLSAAAGDTAPLAALVFTFQIVGCWILVMGANTIRASAWRINYPDAHRGRVMARFAVWQMLIGSIWAAVIGMFLDGRIEWPQALGGATWDLSSVPLAGSRHAYAAIFPISAVACLISTACYRRIRMRRAATEPTDSSLSATTPGSSASTAPVVQSYAIPAWFFSRLDAVTSDLRGSIDVLRQDRKFLSYQVLVFVGGAAVMMAMVPFLRILEHDFEANYVMATAALMFVPQSMVVLFTPLWAMLFDRWPLLRFRAIQMSLWAVSRFGLAAAVATGNMILLWSAVVVSGAALAGGRIAWQIGHMEFSNKENDRLYQSIHQTLTGVRGLTMPLLGTVLYEYVLGEHVILLTAIMLTATSIGYARLHATSSSG